MQIIKVDRAFLTGVPDDAEACAIYEAIMQLADTVHCDVVAEGVETADHLAYLNRIGCRIVQGFHLDRPMPAAEATATLLRGLAPERRG